MNNSTIQYVGEWLVTGNIGHLLTITSMVTAFMATIAYALATKLQTNDIDKANAWKKLARGSFFVHSFAVVGIIALLFILILNHRFEYKYVWQHSSLDLPVHYMISCFWEGQEGSFLLWQFWTAVLGIVLILRAKVWEASVMTVIGFTQIFLAAMLIGLYVFDYKIGSSPFILMRHDMVDLPIFNNPNYLDFPQMQDGTGLNPLLQNYWMVIHPPTLFLGFASSLIPFAYVVASLARKNYDHWVLPTLRWSLFSAAILGLGILMGGAWAYEALSFGGFWAWDPVENASLVPWIVLVAGIHTLLVYKHTGHAFKATAFLLMLSFILVLYSTFLTRSGVLGDTSVHSFTDLGMSGQLLLFLFSFMALGGILMLMRWKQMPSKEKEERTDSREFWMFVGSLVMLLIAGIITLDTSWPVINNIFGTNIAITDAVEHYNRYAIWFGVVIGLMTAVVQFMRYKTSNFKQITIKLLPAAAVSVAISALLAYSLNIYQVAQLMLLIASVYAVVANMQYLFIVLSGKIKIGGASVTHVGFALILLGSLIAMGKQEAISINTLGIDYGEDFDEKNKRENVLLYKNKPIQMGKYWVTYTGDSVVGIDNYYKVVYEEKTNKTDPSKEKFTLYPNAQINPQMGLLANPSTKHFLTKDIFTHVSSVPNKEQQDEETGETLKEITMAVGDTAITNGCFIALKAINPSPINMRYLPMVGDIAAGAQLEITDMNSNQYTAEPVYYIRNNTENYVDANIEEIETSIRFKQINPKDGTILLSVIERTKPQDFIIMKAVVFPYINILWIGCFVMVIGFIISMLRRMGEKDRKSRRVRAAA